MKWLGNCGSFVLLTLLSGSTAGAVQRGLIHRSEHAAEGYTLFAPLRSTSTYLIDTGGEPVHEWKSRRMPGNSVYLLENGHLLRTERISNHPTFRGGGQGGIITEYDWDGNVVWSYECATPTYMQHHDVARLPNGNVLAIAWELKSAEEAVAAGRDPDLLSSGQLWPDMVLELRPIPPNDAEIVWEWHLWDHLVQDFDESKPGYGEIAAHPELVDVNAGGHLVQAQRMRAESERLAALEAELKELRALGYVGEDDDPDEDRRRRRAGVGSDWTHTNSIHYNAELDQILLSVRSFSEIWIIDHSTSTEQAAGHTGGRWGRGGDLLYRWGNAHMYQRDIERHQLRGQHDARWIDAGLPGEGNILIFNNVAGHDGQRRASSVVEIVPPFDAEHGYSKQVTLPFGPLEPHWSYAPGPGSGFFSGRLSGAQRLPGGNTLVCSGDNGEFLQVTAAGETVWEYHNPFLDATRPERPERGRRSRDDEGRFGSIEGRERDDRRERPVPGAAVFRAVFYAADYPGLAALSSSKE